MRILLIAGHGAGDPGAVALGLQEQNLTRELVKLINKKLSQYATVDVFDTSKNMYKYLKAGNKFNFKNYNYAVEIHFNAFNKKSNGTEVLVHTTEKGISVEQKIVDNIAKLGFNNRGVKRRSDLLVMNTCKKSQGVSYALIETCFIDNLDDINTYLPSKDMVASAIARGIVDGFGLHKIIDNTNPIEQAIDKLVKAGIIDTPDYWLNAVKSVEHLDTLIIKFAKTL